MNSKVVSILVSSAIGIYVLGPLHAAAQEASTSNVLVVDSQTVTTEVAADGADHVGAGQVASDGADHVGAGALAADGADRVGGNRLASTETRTRVGGIGSDAVASLR
ncbi:hypothetical protein [Pseudomonas chlororaphis]|uniref:hypothetical protein n=1 Tax=Pseudomonas chlororaphis TaxID=587753 RepID=UPI001F184745|nr:hypothetical protein [Pseudomonas chlororaphis]